MIMKSAVMIVEQVADGANNATSARGANNTNIRSATEQLHNIYDWLVHASRGV
mgnify:CR=1 FL=1